MRLNGANIPAALFNRTDFVHLWSAFIIMIATETLIASELPCAHAGPYPESNRLGVTSVTDFAARRVRAIPCPPSPAGMRMAEPRQAQRPR